MCKLQGIFKLKNLIFWIFYKTTPKQIPNEGLGFSPSDQCQLLLSRTNQKISSRFHIPYPSEWRIKVTQLFGIRITNYNIEFLKHVIDFHEFLVQFGKVKLILNIVFPKNEYFWIWPWRMKKEKKKNARKNLLGSVSILNHKLQSTFNC